MGRSLRRVTRNGFIGAVTLTVALACSSFGQTTTAQRIRIPKTDLDSGLIRKVEPEYPRVALAARIRGAVLLHVIIDETGQVAEVGVISGHPLLVRPAEAAVRQWVYRPYLFDGQRVPVETTVTVNFEVTPKKSQVQPKRRSVQLPQPEVRRADSQTAADRAKRSKEIQRLNGIIRESDTKLQSGRLDDAIKMLEKAVRSAPSHDVLWGKLADAYRMAGFNEDAVRAFEAALAIEPAGRYSAMFSNNLGQSYARLGHIEAALQSYHRAAALDEHSGLYFFNAGALLMNCDRPVEAVAEFDKSLAADPNRVESHYWKGVALAQQATLGEGGKAIMVPGTDDALRRYLELAPSGRYAEHANELLRALKELAD